MLSLSALSYSVIKSTVPNNFLSECNTLKKTWLAVERDYLQIEFLNKCEKKEVVPKYLVDGLPKQKRNITQFGEAHKTLIRDAISKRLGSLSANETELRSKMVFSGHNLDDRLKQVILTHFVKRDVAKIQEKNLSQLKSLCYAKEAKSFQENLQIKPVINISTRRLTKSENESLKTGFNMTWPSRINSNSVKVEIENLYNKIERLPGITNESLGNIHTKLKVHFDAIDRAKDKVTPSKIQSHIKNFLKLRKDKSIYVARFDKGNGVCIDVKERYLHKMHRILSDTTKFSEYKQDKRVKNDSFIYAEENFNRTVKTIFKKHKVSNEIL